MKTLEVVIGYVDGDWPYACQDDVVKTFETIEDAEKWCERHSIRRDSYSIKRVNSTPYHIWKKKHAHS